MTERQTAAPPDGQFGRELRAAVRGSVRLDAAARGLYASDASNYRVPPLGVVLPLDADDVIAAVRVARAFDAPIVGRGGGTSLAGQACNRALVLDFSRHMNRILDVNPRERWARVEPGVVLDDLQAAAAVHGLTFGPDPATHQRCTLGGMIGNNACGAHSVMAELYGSGALTEHQVLELEVLTYDGAVLTVGPTPPARLAEILGGGDRRARIYRDLAALRDRHEDAIRTGYPDIPRRVSGYNLAALLPENGFDVARALVGTESTCVTILEATVRLMPRRPARALVVIGYPDMIEAAERVPEIMTHRPVALEGMDERLTEFMRRKRLHVDEVARLPEGGGWLLVEFGADDPAEAEASARALMDALDASSAAPTGMTLHTDPNAVAAVWRVRESGLGATAVVPGLAPTWPGWEDAAVAPDRVADYLREFRRLLDRYGYDAALYGHFGQGCIHCRINFDLSTAKGVDRYLAFVDEAAELVVRHGGSLSGEHGDGRSRAHLLPKMFGDELVGAFREFKGIWDPAGRMNPGRVVDPDPPGTELRMGPGYRPPVLETHFAFADDEGSFASAVDRCVGVGLCRRKEGGTMCPSYMATGEEMHSTRGRARLLQEMVRGDVVTDGWRSEEVKEALDLCLSCKGCKSDCPVDVDVASYKAEFMAHFYEGRVRPRSAYAMGLIGAWTRLAARAPGLANGIAGSPGLGAVVKRLAGVHPDRSLPRLARTTFQRWYRDRGGSAVDGPRVILWPDTFNDHFHPEVARAAVDVLEALGLQPVLPTGTLCCGRPLYDHGFLGLARRQLTAVVDALRDEVRRGTPVIGLEPSCVATLRDELPGLFPDDPDADRVARQTFLLTEFLDRRPDLDLGGLPGEKAMVHGHCHHRAVLDFDAQQRVLDRIGVEHTVLDSGCCGMAGAFGFREEQYEVAQACGERVLLPAVRRADRRTTVLTDGFSCREMLAQNRLRRPRHSAELLHMALQHDGRLDSPTALPALAPAAPPRPAAVAVAAGAAYLAYRATRTLLRRS
ncbi:MAG: FAD-binding and (Fe-S)-binding domain-containing protein [Longimicrobiales bacterium]|nr:FAD-binding and (Fe-S)-binding domain-containing protein [Longimicrobiales bacterium]